MNQHVTFKIERPFARVWALIAILCLRCVLHFFYWNILLQSLLQIISCVFQHFICDLRNSLVGQRMLNNCAKEFIKIKIYCMCESESDLNVPPTCDAGLWKCRYGKHRHLEKEKLTKIKSKLFDKLLENRVGTKRLPFEDKFGTTLRQLLRKFVSTLTQICHSFNTTLVYISNNFATALTQLWTR